MQKIRKRRFVISISSAMTLAVISIVLLVLFAALLVFLRTLERTMEQNAVISSTQATVQVSNTVSTYNDDMKELMNTIRGYFDGDEKNRGSFFAALFEIRSDVAAITVYDQNGKLEEFWSNGHQIKETILANLSYSAENFLEDEKIYISKPHVETLFQKYYPWVVTINQQLRTKEDKIYRIAMDIRFSSIADYVDQVGIGQHGYCYIIDEGGNIIYHPQQQLIFSSLKKEDTTTLQQWEDGSYTQENVIYTLKSVKNSDWRIVGVSYVEELIKNRMKNVLVIIAALLCLVTVFSLICGIIFSRLLSRPVQSLMSAMEEFERNAANFHYETVHGTIEINALSDSFAHMVLQVQELMAKVRNEEITLRKTELKALQAQINPHFLYNTLDAIGWMCEEERYQDAVEMVNSLATLFRISISKGHELITIAREIEHAKSYLKIVKFRYKNQFSYEFEVDENCLEYLCNKITLQPIIENAIYHGLNRMVDEGVILITIREEDNDIIFEVKDNGVGMSIEQCQEILSKEASDRTGIGIKNVNDRIKIYFGDKYGLEITSEIDEGTSVKIRMPKVSKE